MKRWTVTFLLISMIGLGTLMSFQPQFQIFQKVVSLPTFSLSQLRTYSLSYLTSEDYLDTHDLSFTANEDSTSFQYQEEFMVYNRSVLKHPVGLISYRATIDLKEEKIRYTSDSVYFQNYIRNRYSRYVPDSKSPIPLAEWQEQWSGKEEERFETQIAGAMEAQLQDFVHHIQELKEKQVNAAKLEAW